MVINALVSGPLVDGPVEAFKGAEQPLSLGIDQQQGRLGIGQQQLWGNKERRAVVTSKVVRVWARISLGSH